ncbi:universal stress protein [Balneolaceae bacterium ANBcel3]|nr:universal stress protein [Balneolaceae bacterium ANBcel3]
MSLSFKHALIALDLSPASDVILNGLPDFKMMGTRTVTLFTSVSVPHSGGLSSHDEQFYRERLENYRVKIPGAKDLTIKVRASFGIDTYPPQQILEAAHEVGADYIIAANRGQSRYKEVLLGSTISEVLHRCDLPVYLISLKFPSKKKKKEAPVPSPEFVAPTGHRAFDHILYPTDFSETAERAFQVLFKLSALEKEVIGKNTGPSTRTISLFHVQATSRIGMEDPKQLMKFNQIDLNRLQALKNQLWKATDATIDIDVRKGSPAPEILAKAKEVESSLILMGSQGRGFIKEMFLGGVTHQVIRNADIPVLIIPADRSDEEAI